MLGHVQCCTQVSEDEARELAAGLGPACRRHQLPCVEKSSFGRVVGHSITGIGSRENGRERLEPRSVFSRCVQGEKWGVVGERSWSEMSTPFFKTGKERSIFQADGKI